MQDAKSCSAAVSSVTNTAYFSKTVHPPVVANTHDAVTLSLALLGRHGTVSC
jgi:hypothetical protein